MKQIVCLATSPWYPIPTRKQQVMSRIPDAKILYFDPSITYLAPLKDKLARPKLKAYKAAGEEVLYQTDEDIDQSDQSRDVRRETVLVTDAQRSQNGLVRQVNPPQYQGAVILCQGAGSPSVKLSVVEAVSDATGLTYDRITVLKMK